MQVLTPIDPSIGASGQIDISAADAGCKILLYNLSIYAIQLNFEDGSTAILHAGEANYWTLDGATPTILWTQYSKLNVNNNGIAISQITATLYRPDEQIEGTYPIFSSYQLLVGNTVATTMGGSTSLQNDNNESGTVVYESQVTGSPGSNVIMQNQGLVEVLQWVGGVLTQIFKTNPGGGSVVILGNTGLLTEVLGSLQVDQNIFTQGGGSIGGAGLIYSTIGGANFGLSINGKSSLDNGAILTDNAGHITAVGATLSGNLIENNAIAIQWKDSGGTARTVMQVDSGNNVQLFGVTGNDKVQILKHDGTLEITLDASTGTILVNGGKLGKSASGDILDASDGSNLYVKAAGGSILFQSPNGTTKWQFNITNNSLQFATHDVLYVNTGSGETDLQAYSGNGKIYFKGSDGANRASIDSSGNMILHGTLTQSGTP